MIPKEIAERMELLAKRDVAYIDRIEELCFDDGHEWEQGKELEIGLKKVVELKDIALRLAVSFGEQEVILKMLIESKKDAVRT